MVRLWTERHDHPEGHVVRPVVETYDQRGSFVDRLIPTVGTGSRHVLSPPTNSSV